MGEGQEFIVLNVSETSKGDVRKVVGSVGVKLRKYPPSFDNEQSAKKVLFPLVSRPHILYVIVYICLMPLSEENNAG